MQDNIPIINNDTPANRRNTAPFLIPKRPLKYSAATEKINAKKPDAAINNILFILSIPKETLTENASTLTINAIKAGLNFIEIGLSSSS